MTTLTKNCTESEGWKTLDIQQKNGLSSSFTYCPSIIWHWRNEKLAISTHFWGEFCIDIVYVLYICSDPDICLLADWHHYCHLHVNKFTILTLLCYPTFQFQQELEAFALGQKEWKFFITFAIRRRKKSWKFPFFWSNPLTRNPHKQYDGHPFAIVPLLKYF